MGRLNNIPSYVKFMRGTKEAYQSLVTANQISNDILYFVYDNADATHGVLYLGNKLIGGSDAEVASLKDLSDVALAALEDRQILAYNGNKWVNANLEDILLIDQNALAIDDTLRLTLQGFAAANSGTIASKNEAGKLTWVEPGQLDELIAINQSITNLQNDKANAADVYTKTETLAEIVKAGHLSYKIVDSIDGIDVNAVGADKFIYLVPTGESSGSNLYNEYMVIDKRLEQVGKWAVDLDGYVTNESLTSTLANYVLKSTFDTTVGDLNTEISGLKTRVSQNEDDITALFNFDQKVGNLDDLIINNNSYTTLVEQVNDLTMRLTWEEIPTAGTTPPAEETPTV